MFCIIPAGLRGVASRAAAAPFRRCFRHEKYRRYGIRKITICNPLKIKMIPFGFQKGIF